MNILFMDTETSAREAGEIVELAGVCYPTFQDIPHGQAMVFKKRYKPSRPMEYGAVAVHHILPQELDGKEASARAADDFLQMAAGAQYLVGHNIDYDWKMVGCPNIPRICTMAMAKQVFPNLDSYSLSAIYYYIFGMKEETRDQLKNAHGALPDTYFCIDIFRHICQHFDITSVEGAYLVSEEGRIPKKMGFGKHFGQPISSVPYGYVKWYKSQSDADPMYLEAFRRAGLL